jgi:hypothetical protein
MTLLACSGCDRHIRATETGGTGGTGGSGGSGAGGRD